MKQFTLYLFSLSFFFSFISLNAQEQEWTLEKCIFRSLESNISINQSQLLVEDSELLLSQSKQSRYPSFNGSSNASWNFGRSIDPTTNEFVTLSFFSNNYSVNTGLTLYNGGLINKSIKQSKLNLDASKADARQARNDLSLNVANAFLQVLFSKENIQIAEKQLELSKQQLDQINKSISAGITPSSERLNLESQIKQSEQSLIDAENNSEISMLQLKQLLRLPPDESMVIVVPDSITYNTDPDLVTFEEAFTSALRNRPDLIAGELRTNSAELGVDLAKSGYYPNIGIGGSLNTNYAYNDFTTKKYTRQLDENLSYGFGAQLSVPIYNNGNTRTSVQRAKINVENTRLEYDRLIEGLEITVQQSIANARAAKKKLEASEEAYSAQKLAFENTSKRLEIGAANTFEWEAQKTQMENAEINILIDKYNYLFNIKILEFYLGKPLKL